MANMRICAGWLISHMRCGPMTCSFLALAESAAGAKNSLAMNDYGGKAFRMSAVHIPLSDLVEELAYATGKPVIDQTGLKLEPGTAPYDTVVIDHAEKPSAS